MAIFVLKFYCICILFFSSIQFLRRKIHHSLSICKCTKCLKCLIWGMFPYALRAMFCASITFAIRFPTISIRGALSTLTICYLLPIYTVTSTSNYNGTPLQYTKLSSHCALVPVYIGTYSHSDIRNFRVDSESYKRTNLTYWWFVLILSIIFLLRELTRHCCWKTDLAKILANVNVSMTKNFSLRTLFVLLDAIKKYSRLNFNIS